MQYQKILKKNIDELSSIYLLHGEDTYLMDEFIKKFLDNFAEQKLKDFNLNIIEEDENLVNKLLNSAKTLPFMAEKRIIVVKSYDLFRKKFKDSNLILNLIEDFPESTIVLFVSYKKPKKNLKIYKRIKKSGEVLNFSALKYKKLDDWIAKQFKTRDYQINRSAIKLLEEAFNNNLQRLTSEIDKIITFVGEKKEVSKNDVKLIISKDWLIKETILFDFVDAIGQRKTDLALKLLESMMEEGRDAKQILGMIARQIRLMLQSKVLAEEGMRAEAIAKRLKQHPYPIKKCLRQSHNFSIESLELALEKLFESDCRLVTGSDQKLEMEFLVIELKEVI